MAIIDVLRPPMSNGKCVLDPTILVVHIPRFLAMIDLVIASLGAVLKREVIYAKMWS